jgi:hypothetical protein
MTFIPHYEPPRDKSGRPDFGEKQVKSLAEIEPGKYYIWLF